MLAIGQAFASVDPVKPDPATGTSFNRYSYASNNPYTFNDPDGRDVNYVPGGTVTQAELRRFIVTMAMSTTARAEFQQLEQSREMYTFQLDSRAENWFDQTTRTIYVNPKSYTIIRSSKELLAPELNGIHETSHAAEFDRIGSDAFNRALQPTMLRSTDASGRTTATPQTSPEEKRATGVERAAAKEIGLPARLERTDTCRRGENGC